ncbi:hypothetical protein D3Y57_16370 [Sphingomonas paeninsulae]|jgi:hypothetical protein|uniref:Uncharacterized protein n=1 Tax=Sphingomonas paeninsulae TaxID=2319844 RepID=A0A494TCK8_SPHPE|nr:hypothetical protein [Sphingomonas paeninsulae]AYJ87219.1 hypothetical protein D3Y57_16370 [Sphingomonas paeninsulae]
MKFRSILLVSMSVAVAHPAAAQIFWQSPDFRGTPIIAGEAGIGIPMPGATPAEESAALAWQLRSGLNVMALQCQFDKTLLAQDSYNGILINHREELTKDYNMLNGYFMRLGKTKKAAQDLLDKYGTKNYTSFSTVRAQYGFCQAASNIARATLFAPRGSFQTVAVERLRELRNSLVPQGEQLFRFGSKLPISYPDFSKKCWSSRGYKNCAYTNGI